MQNTIYLEILRCCQQGRKKWEKRLAEEVITIGRKKEWLDIVWKTGRWQREGEPGKARERNIERERDKMLKTV